MSRVSGQWSVGSGQEAKTGLEPRFWLSPGSWLLLPLFVLLPIFAHGCHTGDHDDEPTVIPVEMRTSGD